MTPHRRFMLDTDTISFVFRGEGAAAANLTAHAPSEVCLSAISLCELRFGADKRRSKRLHQLIDTFIATVDVVAFDATAAAVFGRLSRTTASIRPCSRAQDGELAPRSRIASGTPSALATAGRNDNLYSNDASESGR